MKRLILFLVCIISSLSVYGQTRMNVQIDNAPFIMFDNLDNSDSDYRDLEKLQSDWPLYYIRKGTELTVLSSSYYKTMLRVRLDDGSVGYMPTVAIAFKDLSFKLESMRSKLPAGEYVLNSVGPFKYMSSHNKNESVYPEYYSFKNKSNGRNYRLQEAEQIFFDAFFEKYPGLQYQESELQDLKLKDGELPVGYIGCSKSYIESVIGPAYSYAGPGISQYSSYVFALYTNVAWDTEISKKYDDAGLVIYYDKDLRAVHMEKKPINFYYDDFFTKLYVPKEAIAPLDAQISQKISDSRRKAPYYYKAGTQPLEEVYSSPEDIDRVRVRSMYFIETTLGVTNRWAILGILLGICILASCLINLAIRYCMPWSNATLKIISIVLNGAVALYAIIYVSRFFIIPAIMAGFIIMIIAMLGAKSLFPKIDKERCRFCGKWEDDPMEVARSNGDWVLDRNSLRNSAFSKTIFKVEETEYKDDVRFDWIFTKENLKSEYTMRREVVKTFECRSCHKRWTERSEQTRIIPGPIYFQTTLSGVSTYTAIVQDTEYEKDPETGLMVPKRVVSSERKTIREDIPTNKEGCYDTEDYEIALQRYLAGDDGALEEYEHVFYGNFECELDYDD